MDFVIWTWFVVWALAFELYLSFASMRESAGLHGSQKQMANRRNEAYVLSGLSVPEAIALRMKKSRRTLGKQVILTKRIIPASLMLLPPMAGTQVSPVYLNIDAGREVLA